MDIVVDCASKLPTLLVELKKFGKNHGDVLRAIDEVLTQVTDSFRESNFAFSGYTVPGQLRKYPMCELTRDGFTILAMGFTGKRHDNVLQTIENLECSVEFAELNFQVCFEINHLANGKKIKYYTLTRDAFTILAISLAFYFKLND